MAMKLLVSVFLQMDGPGQFDTAKVKITNEYLMDTPGNQAMAVGAHTGTRDAIQDLPAAMKGNHYAVVPSFVFA